MARSRSNALLAGFLGAGLVAGCTTTTPLPSGGGVVERPDVEPFAPGSTVRPFDATSVATPDPVFNVLFVADRASYGGFDSPADVAAFEADVRAAIEQGFNAVEGFYRNRDHIHYYISDVAGAVSYDARCVVKDFSGVADDVRIGDDQAVFDLRLILHKRGWPDCREGRKASADAGDFGTIAHEAAHALFGAPDEYGGIGWVTETDPPVMFDAGRANAVNDCRTLRQGLPLPPGTPPTCETVVASGDDWLRADTGEDLMSIRQHHRTAPQQFGPADWGLAAATMRRKPGVFTPTAPTTFAPEIWTRP